MDAVIDPTLFGHCRRVESVAIHFLQPFLADIIVNHDDKVGLLKINMLHSLGGVHAFYKIRAFAIEDQAAPGAII